MEIITLRNAAELPEAWDRLAIDYFQTRKFLGYTEEFNPCEQRYYLLLEDGKFKAGVIVYFLKIDLFTFLSIPSPFHMHIAGIPCSVSSSGFIGDSGFIPDLFNHIKIQQKGLLLALNLDSDTRVNGMMHGRTLPTIILKQKYKSWDEYQNSLRANYRRRILLVSQKFSGIKASNGSCSRFNDQMYLQYLQVLKRSKGKLETLSQAFFKNLPPDFRLTDYYYNDTLIGWYISVSFKDKYYFFFGGIDYTFNERFSTYFNILFGVLREGFENNADFIDLGQTAEIPKMRLGGTLVEKTMMAYHSNSIMRKMLKAGKSLLEYSVNVEEMHVIKVPQ